MTSSPPSSFDSEQFKIAQRQRWDSVAEGWKKWWQTIEVAAQKVNDRLVELAQINMCLGGKEIKRVYSECNISSAQRVSKLPPKAHNGNARKSQNHQIHNKK